MDLEDRPCRETAETVIEGRIRELKLELRGLEDLLTIAKGFGPGSPAEEILWRILSRFGATGA